MRENSQTFTMKLLLKLKWQVRLNRLLGGEKYKMKFVTWWDKKFPGKYCWADCVSWAFAYDRWNPFKIESSRGCEIESKTDGLYKMCYCGGWKDGICFAKLPKEEQLRIRQESDAERKQIEDDLPF